MSYHIRIEYSRSDGELRLNLTEEELITQYLTPFHNGENLMINGREIHQQGIARIKIFSGPIESAIEKIKYEDQFEPPLKTLLSYSVEWRAVDLLIDVTNKYITRPPAKKERIEIKEEIAEPSQVESYIAIDRIEELRIINNKSWDLSKLIRLCEEINDNWQTKNYFSVAALLRTILHYVPPIFGFSSIEEVTNNYAGGTSFKKVMKHLLDSSKNIGDLHLHGQVKAKDALPNDRQVDYRNNLDLLLCEIIKLIK